VLQANYLIEKGALEITEDGRFRPVPAEFFDALKSLAHELLMIQAEGSYEGARALVDSYGSLDPAMDAALKSLTAIPVDIDPVYPMRGLQ